jgi:hypothetical protein
MNPRLSHLILIGAAVLGGLAPFSSAQTLPGNKKGPTSKLYVAETVGETQIENNGKIYLARQATTYDAPGTIIETKANSHDAFVYSNGTGMFVDQNSRVEISHFAQEPFPSAHPPGDATLAEPSISQSDVLIARGSVGICTSQMLSGSTMTYSTRHAQVNIRRGKVSIQTSADSTIIDLLEGDITVRTGDKDPGGEILRPGERATIRPGASGQPPSLTISPIPPEALAALEQRATIACNAKKTVAFKTIGKEAGTESDTAAGADQEIVASPTVPAKLPSNITISADRLPGGP